LPNKSRTSAPFFSYQNSIILRATLIPGGKVRDVSAIAKKFGGGGHKNASGCSLKIHPSEAFVDKP
jgi:nanoRNase/pAp phosphatase (c-di-AMP/oligoRNAs hydrolase)